MKRRRTRKAFGSNSFSNVSKLNSERCMPPSPARQFFLSSGNGLSVLRTIYHYITIALPPARWSNELSNLKREYERRTCSPSLQMSVKSTTTPSPRNINQLIPRLKYNFYALVSFHKRLNPQSTGGQLLFTARSYYILFINMVNGDRLVCLKLNITQISKYCECSRHLVSGFQGRWGPSGLHQNKICRR